MVSDQERAYIHWRSRVDALIDAQNWTEADSDAYRNIASMINEAIIELDRAAVKLSDEAVGGESFDQVVLKLRVRLPDDQPGPTGRAVMQAPAPYMGLSHDRTT
jgi:hypothetical protein